MEDDVADLSGRDERLLRARERAQNALDELDLLSGVEG
jgi:hypothetical protein